MTAMMIIHAFFQAGIDLVATLLASAVLVVILARCAYRLSLLNPKQLAVLATVVIVFEVVYGSALWLL